MAKNIRQELRLITFECEVFRATDASRVQSTLDLHTDEDLDEMIAAQVRKTRARELIYHSPKVGDHQTNVRKR